MKNLTQLSIILLLALAAKAQNNSFMQFNSTPLYYNPGYAGSVESPRLALVNSYRYQSHYPGNNYAYSYLSYDQAIKRMHSGVGLVMYTNYLNNINKSSSYLREFYCGFAYAAKFNIAGKLTISPAVKIGYRKDELFRGTFRNSQETTQTQNADLSLGLVLNTEKFHFGFAVDHLNQPRVSSIQFYHTVPLSKRYTGQLGYVFQKYKGADFSVTTGLLFEGSEDNPVNLNLNSSVRYKFIVVGGGLSAGNGGGMFNVLLGYYSKKYRIGYSLEPPVRSYPYSSTKHELSIRYIFSPPKDEKGVDEKPVKKRRVSRNRKRILQT